jgi:methionyl-tRNA synthetase
MKANRKNRKLNFIRTKNGLRLGYRRYYWMTKINPIMLDDCIFNWNDFVERAKGDLIKHYKLKLANGEVANTGYVGDDFVKNLMTIQVILYK